ncbi:juvenile hormone esterase-like [Manduca sexta]|uniref:juvenile hormone esterase-like n=1 Tax=Manduca sexta TaxID=7130 RepID=UPI00188EDBB1|nr:juvenile hormone esterase-like [Manduca sexta]
MLCLLVLLGAAATAAAQTSESRVVTTHHGPIRGYKDPDGSMYSFYDVPYATAPTGRDKFKAPLPPPTWTQPFEAVFRGIICPQLDILITIPHIMQEDCLVANIFVPDTNDTNLPVVVNVHGGGFVFGSGSIMHLTNFVKNNSMILITFNYRLAAYGFLCLGTENVPGNAGMKDQVALLRWVNQNIAQFGGNPNDVTVMGCSAGGISTDLLTISNMTRNLFHRAIPESGCSYGAFAIQYDPIQNARDYARLLNDTNIDSFEDLEEFYLTVSAETLATRLVTTSNHKDSRLTFTACLERDVGVEMFLQDDPADILKKGDFPAMPFLYGLAKEEGMPRTANVLTGWLSKMNEHFSDFLPHELEFESVQEKDRVANTVRTFYFGNRPIGLSTIPEYVDYYTDVMFGYRMMKGLTLRLEAKDQPIYLHQYSFLDENTQPMWFTNVTGTDHCEQANIISDHDTTGKTDAYINMQNMMRSLWTNFILTGKPVPDGSSLPTWPATNITRSPYMDLGPVVRLENSMFGARFELWDGIYEKHYRKPMRPNPNMPGSAKGVASNVYVLSLVVCSLASRFFY